MYRAEASTAERQKEAAAAATEIAVETQKHFLEEIKEIEAEIQKVVEAEAKTKRLIEEVGGRWRRWVLIRFGR